MVWWPRDFSSLASSVAVFRSQARVPRIRLSNSGNQARWMGGRRRQELDQVETPRQVVVLDLRPISRSNGGRCQITLVRGPGTAREVGKVVAWVIEREMVVRTA